jgi:hypothetical protein
MHESIKNKIDQAYKTLHDTLYYALDIKTRTAAVHIYHDTLAQIVYHAGNSMSSTEKLAYLRGELRREDRKVIVKHMLEHEHADPNSWHFVNELFDTVIYEDNYFATYLLNHGTQPDIITIERAQKSSLMAPLFAKYLTK